MWALIATLLFSVNISANDDDYNEEDPVSVTLVSENESVMPGTPFWVAIHMQLDDHWHSYWKNPGDIGMPISVEWDLPEGYEASTILWPTPKRYDNDSIIGYGYEGEVTLLSQITPPKNVEKEVALTATVDWLACSDSSCLPGSVDLSLSLPVKHSIPKVDGEAKALIDRAKLKIPHIESGTVSALRKQDLIEVVMQSPPASNNGYKACFFPEDTNVFNNQFEATIYPDDSASDSYIVALKELDSLDAKASHVKGVLVIHDRLTDDVIDSLELNVPIEQSINDEAKLVSMRELSQVHAMEGPQLTAMQEEETSPFDGGFIFYLVTAFIGGMILNLMPCVLPVISLKIMSFVNMSGEDRKKILFHGFSFSLGVLISFWALAGALLILQTYGHSVGWGFQLQQPIVIAILATVILVFGLSMFGVFEFGTSLSAMAGQAQVKSQKKGESLTSSFFSGVLATAVATPCTGPFLGPAVGFAVTQPAMMSMLIFTSLGLGMASPYLLLSAFPSCLKYMPKPGNWMITFKEVTGFIMMAVVLWLLWIFGAQTDSLALFGLLASLLIISVGCWIYGKWASPIRKKRTRIVGMLAAFVCLAIGGEMAYSASTAPVTTLDDKRPVSLGDHHQTGEWVDFDAGVLQDLREGGTPVFVDFTAKWCLICQANHLVLSVDKVDKKLQEMGVVKMKADWTKHDPDITKFLKKYGRNGVPLYLLYSGNSEHPPEVLPQVLTPDIVLEYLDAMKKPVAMGNEKSYDY